MSLFFFLLFFILHTSSKDIITRIREQQKIVDLPTPRMILRLMEQQKQHYIPEAEKQLKKLIPSYETQMSRALRHFLATTTEVTEYTPILTTRLALFLIRHDDELLGSMLSDERDALLLRIEQFYGLEWPENGNLLMQIIQEAKSADEMRQNIRRLDTLTDKHTIHTTLERIDILYGKENIPLRRHIRRYLKSGKQLNRVIDLWKLQ